jgi:hypothetical protein
LTYKITLTSIFYIDNSLTKITLKNSISRDKETKERALKSFQSFYVKKKRMRRKRCFFPVFSSLPCLSVCLSVCLSSFSFLSFYLSQNIIVFKLENTNRRVPSEKRYIYRFLSLFNFLIFRFQQRQILFYLIFLTTP